MALDSQVLGFRVRISRSPSSAGSPRCSEEQLQRHLYLTLRALQGRFVGRDVAAIGDAFGEIFLYYNTINPATGSIERKVSIVQRVTAYGIPILVGAGYFVD